MEDRQKKIFSENLNSTLYERNKTQKEVADAIGVSPQTFNTWCKGIALPRMGKLQALADYFHMNKTELLDQRSEGSTGLPSASPTTPEEIELIEKYRVLDDYGKKNVNMILNNEFERCIQTDREENEPISSAPSDSVKAG